MNQGLLRVNVSRKANEEDLIKIGMTKGSPLVINFRKLYNQSEYLLSKYKYSEALKCIDKELEEYITKYNIKETSLKEFIQLVEEDSDEHYFPIESYNDIYKLSEYLNIPKITIALDKAREEELYSDLAFTLIIFIESERSQEEIEKKMNIKIENFLRTRINECLNNDKFRELQISTICRLLSQSQNKVDQEKLLYFIIKSGDSHLILIQFVNFEEIREEKIEELIEFIEEDETRKKYLEYLPFNYSFLKT